MNKQDKVSIILNDLAKLDKDKIPYTPENSIDMEKMAEIEETKKAVKELKELNVDSKWLFDNGFVPAGLIFGRILDK